MSADEVLAEHDFARVPSDVRLPGNGLGIHCLVWGDAAASSLVFLHGGGLTAHSWDVVCDLMSSEYRCIAVDLRGHGDSDWSEAGEYGLEAHASDIEAVVGHLGLGDFVLIGQSLGGLTALTFAGSRPRGLDALVLVDTGPRGGRRAGRERLRAFMDGPVEHETLEDFVERAAEFNPRRPPERLRRSLLHNLRRTSRGTWTWKYDRRITDPIQKDDGDARRERLLAAAARVDRPVFVVRGGESEHFHNEDATATAELFSDGRWVVIPGAGHTVQGDRPDELARALRNFLNEVTTVAKSGPPPPTA